MTTQPAYQWWDATLAPIRYDQYNVGLFTSRVLTDDGKSDTLPFLLEPQSLGNPDGRFEFKASVESNTKKPHKITIKDTTNGFTLGLLHQPDVTARPYVCAWIRDTKISSLVSEGKVSVDHYAYFIDIGTNRATQSPEYESLQAWTSFDGKKHTWEVKDSLTPLHLDIVPNSSIDVSLANSGTYNQLVVDLQSAQTVARHTYNTLPTSTSLDILDKSWVRFTRKSGGTPASIGNPALGLTWVIDYELPSARLANFAVDFQQTETTDANVRQECGSWRITKVPNSPGEVYINHSALYGKLGASQAVQVDPEARVVLTENLNDSQGGAWGVPFVKWKLHFDEKGNVRFENLSVPSGEERWLNIQVNSIATLGPENIATPFQLDVVYSEALENEVLGLDTTTWIIIGVSAGALILAIIIGIVIALTSGKKKKKRRKTKSASTKSASTKSMSTTSSGPSGKKPPMFT